jgi:Porin subfamily
MKMVKSLLLGSAAGLVAAAGAQAADLPVKAKPVEYVKVCSLYGAGFFYIPGTDTCIKLGGAVRVQEEWNAGAGGIANGFSSAMAAQGRNDRFDTNDTNFRTRIYFSVDTRQQTEYGTLRSFFRFGANETSPTDGPTNGTLFWDRAFIQFAGFTVGRTLSFFDGISMADFSYHNQRTMGDTGPSGITVWGYTAQFGNGISGTLSAEDPNARTRGTINTAFSGFGPSVLTTSNGLSGQSATNNGFDYPDVIGALRVDQAWGSAQVMAAMHDASGAYYGTTAGGTISLGHPNNAFGWAAGGALVINLPSWGATSNVNSQPNVDQFKVQGVYGRGAAGYATAMGNSPIAYYNSNNKAGLAWLAEGVYGTGTSVELTTVWSVNGGYQHLWTPNWRTSVYGGYINVSYDSAATALICPAGTAVAGGFLTVALGNCNPNFSIWEAGTRTQWNPVSQLDIGVDLLYTHLNTAFGGTGATVTANGVRPASAAGAFTVSDQDVFSVMFRVQRNFWP